jgi:D-beta-D-heptose 7-phosphate kinase/D-beta-D-heptose 1-phosphate adenosyltransferase
MKSLLSLIPRFSSQKILVVGDFMIDKFVWGKVSRVSPEAPVPVVEVTRETFSLGGAGNVANNLTSLGAQVYCVGALGEDTEGDYLRNTLKAQHINASFDALVNDPSRPTIIKTRIIASQQQVVRVDKELKGNFSPEIVRKLVANVEAIIPEVNAVIISDYGKGVINLPMLKSAIALARKYKLPITVDPKIEHFMNYKGVTCINPNMKEALEGMREVDAPDEAAVRELGKKILKKLRSESVLITRSEKGMTLFQQGNKITHIPTRAREVFDVTGAGDTVISVFTLALSCGATQVQAAEIANFAAGVVVGKLGTAPILPDELKTAIMNFKG